MHKNLFIFTFFFCAQTELSYAKVSALLTSTPQPSILTIAQNSSDSDDFSFVLETDEFNFEEDYEDSAGSMDEMYPADEISGNDGFITPEDSAEEVVEVEEEIRSLNAPEVERVRPKETNRHYFIKHPNQKKGLYKISADGKYYYRVKESPKKYGIAVKGGAFLFKDLVNPQTQIKFTEVYGTSAKPTLFIEYLWPFFKNRDVPKILKAARLKLGGGLLFASGHGLFGDGNYSGIRAPEKYTFIGLPLEVGLQYAFEFFDEQIFIPYGTAALSYMLGMEVQDGRFQRGATKFMGQAGAHLSGGVALGLGWLEESAKFDLDAEFGINQAYLTVEFRQNIALQQDFKFTSASIVGGLWLEF